MLGPKKLLNPGSLVVFARLHSVRVSGRIRFSNPETSNAAEDLQEGRMHRESLSFSRQLLV